MTLRNKGLLNKYAINNQYDTFTLRVLCWFQKLKNYLKAYTFGTLFKNDCRI